MPLHAVMCSPPLALAQNAYKTGDGIGWPSMVGVHTSYPRRDPQRIALLYKCGAFLQVVETVLGLISDSLDAWRTRQYDYYQRVLNGIL